jgi:eukaryotic-like serine/threonine-protein kinase
VPGGKVERIDSEDFRALASASKALIGSVARDLADRRRDRRADDRSGGKRNAEPLDADRRRGENRGAPSRRPVAPVAEPPRRRRRFKRRWVVVPVLTTVIVVVLLLIGAAVGLAAILGLI